MIAQKGQNFLAFPEIETVFHSTSCASTSFIILPLVFFRLVGMAGISLIAACMFVINILNVLVIIAYPINMYVMEDKTAHLEMMNIDVFNKIVQVYSDVKEQIYVSIIMNFVTITLIAQMEMMRFCVKFRLAHQCAPAS